ncbi:hypothetical protein [Streptomyces sp. A5-4]|uniref:hypothetical protein n=1 Tax=Streptomyces sp. A5-4 TaxID=3384771 RepID=UPI003DA8EEB6
MRMGPARSGISFAIDRMPDKEQKIVFVRLREIEHSVTATLDAIKKLAETDTATGTGTETGKTEGAEA